MSDKQLEDHNLSVAFFKLRVAEMPDNEVRESLINLYREMLIKENQHKINLAKAWGIGS
jgi:hypothetical protein